MLSQNRKLQPTEKRGDSAPAKEDTPIAGPWPSLSQMSAGSPALRRMATFGAIGLTAAGLGLFLGCKRDSASSPAATAAASVSTFASAARLPPADLWVEGEPLSDFLTGEKLFSPNHGPTHAGIIGSLADLNLPRLLKEGKVVVLDFWATWCAPCHEETPHINELIRKFGSEVIVVVVTPDNHRTVQDWLAAGTTSPGIIPQAPILTGAGPLAEKVGIEAYPSVVVFAPKSPATERRDSFAVPGGVAVLKEPRPKLKDLERAIRGAKVSGASPDNPWYQPGTYAGAAAELGVQEQSRPSLARGYASGDFAKFISLIKAPSDPTKIDLEKFLSFYSKNLPLKDTGKQTWAGDPSTRLAWLGEALRLIPILSGDQQAAVLRVYSEALLSDPSETLRAQAARGVRSLLSALPSEARFSLLRDMVKGIEREPLAGTQNIKATHLGYMLSDMGKRADWNSADYAPFASELEGLIERVRSPAVKWALRRAWYLAQYGQRKFAEDNDSILYAAYQEFHSGKFAQGDYRGYVALEAQIKRVWGKPTAASQDLDTLFAQLKQILGPAGAPPSPEGALGAALISNACKGDTAPRSLQKTDPAFRHYLQSQFADLYLRLAGHDHYLEEIVLSALVAVGVDRLEPELRANVHRTVVRHTPDDDLFPGVEWQIRYLLEGLQEDSPQARK